MLVSPKYPKLSSVRIQKPLVLGAPHCKKPSVSGQIWTDRGLASQGGPGGVTKKPSCAQAHLRFLQTSYYGTTRKWDQDRGFS